MRASVCLCFTTYSIMNFQVDYDAVCTGCHMSLTYHVPETLYDTSSGHSMLTMGQRKFHCQAGSNYLHFYAFSMSWPGIIPCTSIVLPRLVYLQSNIFNGSTEPTTLLFCALFVVLVKLFLFYFVIFLLYYFPRITE